MKFVFWESTCRGCGMVLDGELFEDCPRCGKRDFPEVSLMTFRRGPRR